MSDEPIVAELGRPETPDEKSARVAESRRKRRANQNVRNLVGSLIASLAIVVFLVLVVVRPDPTPETVDYAAVAAEVSASLGTEVVAPVVPPSWSANRAELTGSGGVDEWVVGFITDDDSFIALLQGFDANPTWLAAALRSPGASETVTIADREWERFDRRDDDTAGLREFALVTETEASTVVLYGTATDAAFAVLATAVAAELEDR